MRNELELMALIDSYFDGLLGAEDVIAFEMRMNNNAEFKALVSEQEAIRGGMQRIQLRTAAESAYRSYRLGKWGPALGGGLLIVLIGLGWFMLGSNHVQGERQVENVGIEHRDSTGVEIGLESLFYDIVPSENKTLVTPNGIVLDIPKGAFIYEDGTLVTENVSVEFKEALDAADIVKAGLSTMSGNKLLETGGMFYLDARVNGVQVQMNPEKTITAMVPDINELGDMQLFEGVEQSNGSVDWQDPTPLIRSLVPVDITTLDFYPPEYMPKLAELGEDVRNKKFTDSLYYSFAWKEHEVHHSELWWEDALYRMKSKLSPETLPTWDRLAEQVGANDDPSSSDISYNTGSTGRQLFLANCASCHKTDRPMTGPALHGARARWERKGDIYAFSKNSAAYLKTGNEYANELFRAWGSVAMTPQSVSDAELNAIFDYADQQSVVDTLGGSQNDSAAFYKRGVNPANIKTIWNQRFNNTNLATREFEERLRAVFASCSTELLDKYVQNLGRDLMSIDAEIAGMGYSAFAEFAERNDGKVDLPEEAAERLAKKYEEWSRLEAAAIAKTQASFWKQQRAMDAQAAKRSRADEDDENAEFSKRYNQELNANLASVYSQLGYGSTQGTVSTRGFAIPRRAFVVPVRTTGWKNVDRLVRDATATRTSMSYTDPQTGKTATLTYTPFSVTVLEASSYDQLRVYLLPVELNSYQRINSSSDDFEESLNALLDYDLFVLGVKRGERYFYQESEVHEKGHTAASMQVISEEKLLKLLNKKGKVRGTYMLNKSNYLLFAAKDNKRQTHNRSLLKLRREVAQVVFCTTVAITTPVAEEEEA